MKLTTSFVFYIAIFNLLASAADDAKMGLCEEDHILIKSLHEFKDTDERISDKMTEKTTLNEFLNICKNNARLLGSEVAED